MFEGLLGEIAEVSEALLPFGIVLGGAVLVGFLFG